MMQSQPEQNPITGEEELRGLTQPTQALSQFYSAFNGRDLAVMSENWDQSQEAAMDNPLGGIKRGWPEIKSVYERIFNGPAKVYVEFYDYTIHSTENMFYAVGRERGRLQVNELVMELAIRTSRIFKKLDGKWKQAHHHGSIDDPDLLKKYQNAVSGK